jgi:hypothetical protein
VHPGELFDVLNEGVAMLIATREAGEHEYGGASISPESIKRIGHRMTIPINDLSVKDLETKKGLCSSRGSFGLDDDFDATTLKGWKELD